MAAVTLPLALIAGCGDDGAADGDTSASTGAMSGAPSTDTAATRGNGSSTAADPDDTGAPPGTTGASTGNGSTGPNPTGSDSGSSSDSGDGSDSSGSDSTGEELEEVDCALAPATTEAVTLIEGARGYHGLVITPDGLIIGSDGASLIQSTYDGDFSVFVPGIGEGEQMTWLADGDFAYATDDNALSRIGLDATVQTMVPGLNPYSVITGPDEMLYAVSYFGGTLRRIDPITNEVTVVLGDLGLPNYLHSLGFSPDGTRLYVGTIGGTAAADGEVYYVDFDETMTPTTGMELFTTGVRGPGLNQWHDGIAVDACGNLFIADFESKNVFRVTPGGVVSDFWVPESAEVYAHGLTWGTGQDGWKLDAIYVPQPYNNNTVSEMMVGIPPADYAGPVVNAEPMQP